MKKYGVYYLDSTGHIRRPVYRDGTQSQERYPIKKYRHLRGNEEELQKLVVRINQPTLEQRAREVVTIKHAFIDEKLLAEYHDELLAQSSSEERVNCVYFYLRNYFLNFFIGEQKLSNPVDWHRVHRTVWADYLWKHPVVRAAATKREVIQAANAFMKWLHFRRPDEVPPLEFRPLTKNQFKTIEAERRVAGENRERLYIPKADWDRIQSNSGKLLPHMHLAACYGLRRSEVLGLLPEHVFANYLRVEQQLDRLNPRPIYCALKGKKPRNVEHWYSHPDQTLEWIELVNAKLIHPDTLTARWSDLMKRLSLPYDFHDLRHTYITLAIREFKAADVMQNAGHESLETTNGYIHDGRELKEDPESA